MLDNFHFQNVLFIDIETVPLYPSYENLPGKWKSLWDIKASHLTRTEEPPSELYRRAGIYAEFGKVICVSAGYFRLLPGGQRHFRIKSFFGDTEKDLLLKFAELLNMHFNGKNHLLCAHNGKEFDFPYLSRRMLVNGISLPKLLDNAGKKPWEVNLLDTMEMWRFGDNKSFTSLLLLTSLFDIPTPKGDIDGSMVYEVYWKNRDLPRIVKYCQRDVVAVAQIMLKFKGEPLLSDAEIMETEE